MLYVAAASWLAILTKSIPNWSTSPSICSRDSRISSHSAQSSSSSVKIHCYKIANLFDMSNSFNCCPTYRRRRPKDVIRKVISPTFSR